MCVPLGATQRKDTLLREHIERHGVDALLVDHHKVLVGRVAHALLELDQLPHLVVHVLTLGLHQLNAHTRNIYISL